MIKRAKILQKEFGMAGYKRAFQIAENWISDFIFGNIGEDELTFDAVKKYSEQDKEAFKVYKSEVYYNYPNAEKIGLSPLSLEKKWRHMYLRVFQVDSLLGTDEMYYTDLFCNPNRKEIRKRVEEVILKLGELSDKALIAFNNDITEDECISNKNEYRKDIWNTGLIKCNGYTIDSLLIIKTSLFEEVFRRKCLKRIESAKMHCKCALKEKPDKFVL